jgi:hypothetical protein
LPHGICRKEGHLALFKVQGELLRPSLSVNFSHAFLQDRDCLLFPRRVHPEGRIIRKSARMHALRQAILKVIDDKKEQQGS